MRCCSFKYSVYHFTSDKLSEADDGYQNSSSRLLIVCVDLKLRLKLQSQTDRLQSPSVRLANPFLLTTFASNACPRLANLRQNCRRAVGSRKGRYPDLPQDSLRSLSRVSAYSTPVWRGNCVASLFCSVPVIVSPGTVPVRDVPAFVAFVCDKVTVLGKAITETPRCLYSDRGAIRMRNENSCQSRILEHSKATRRLNVTNWATQCPHRPWSTSGLLSGYRRFFVLSGYWRFFVLSGYRWFFVQLKKIWSSFLVSKFTGRPKCTVWTQH